MAHQGSRGICGGCEYLPTSLPRYLFCALFYGYRYLLSGGLDQVSISIVRKGKINAKEGRGREKKIGGGEGCVEIGINEWRNAFPGFPGSGVVEGNV